MDIDGRGGSEVALWMVMMDETPTPTHTHTHTNNNANNNIFMRGGGDETDVESRLTATLTDMTGMSLLCW